MNRTSEADPQRQKPRSSGYGMRLGAGLETRVAHPPNLKRSDGAEPIGPVTPTCLVPPAVTGHCAVACGPRSQVRRPAQSQGL